MSGPTPRREPRTKAAKALLASPWTGEIATHPHPLSVRACWFCRDLAAIESEARAAVLTELAEAVVDIPCRHAADFGAGPYADPGPCLIDSEAVLHLIEQAQKGAET